MTSSLLLKWIFILPLLGALLNGLGNKFIPKKLSGFIASTAVFVSFCFAISLFTKTSSQWFTQKEIELFPFININTIKIPFSILLDRLNAIYMLIITGVGFLIHVYSIAYMKTDEGVSKYFVYLNLFIFSMLLLVLGANYLILFMGWEGVGVCSFFLIGFWFENKNYVYAAKKAFIINRIGDACFLLALFFILFNYNTLSFTQLSNLNIVNDTTNNTILICITLLLFLGATGKSAQFPLFTWLPDAMAGPTPVSALIHAATMVTAGIYLICRSHFFFSITPVVQQIITIIGILTALITATIATQQNDIKKILAYSTVSQLGLIFVSLGVGNYVGAVFHVLTHAFFKALLFLGAGSVIHAMHHEQNIIKMGGLAKHIKITHITFLIGALALVGIPGFSGFFSKDSILLAAYAKHPIYYILSVIASALTTFYIFRLYFLTFHGAFRGSHEQKSHLHESPLLMTIPLIILAILSIIGGFINIPHALYGHETLSHFLEKTLPINALNISLKKEYILMIIPFALTLIIIFITQRVYNQPTFKETKNKNILLEFFYNKWYIDELYDACIVKPILSLSHFFSQFIEKRVINGAIQLFVDVTDYLSYKIRYFQSGKIETYLLWMIIAIIILLTMSI